MFVNSLTVAALLTHALWGCYGHQALGCSHLGESAPVAVTTPTCCNYDHDHPCGQPAENESPAGPCQCDLACHGGCVTLPPQKTQIDFAPVGVWINWMADVPTALSRDAGVNSSRERGQPPTAVEPPVPLHLLHQSILV
jgi:hypothetical protein